MKEWQWEGVLNETLDEAVKSRIQNSWPISDQKNLFLTLKLRLLWPFGTQFPVKFYILFHTVEQNIPISGKKCKTPHLISKKNCLKTIPFGAAHTSIYIADIEEFISPPPAHNPTERRGELEISGSTIKDINHKFYNTKICGRRSEVAPDPLNPFTPKSDFIDFYSV